MGPTESPVYRSTDLRGKEFQLKHFCVLSSDLTLNAAFLIGSIDEINTKISKLDKKLHSYTELVIDSQASDDLDTYFKPPSAKQREIYQKKGNKNLLILLNTLFL